MKLKELLPFQYKIKESPDAKNREGVLCTVEGIFQRADTKNANGRVYPSELWNRVLGNEEVSKAIENRRMLGMLGHPASGQTDPEKISHIITRQELRPDGTVYGEADILDTPVGRVVETLFKAGVQLGISSRGDGSVEKKGDTDIVQDDFRLETYDFVLKPSTPGAYPVLSENIEENEQHVTEAIKGLVESELPAKQRVPVLLECLKILSVLEANKAGEMVKSLSSKITEELGKPSKPLVSVSAKETTPTVKESNMGAENKQPQLEGQVLAWHQREVANAARKVAAVKEQEIKGLKDQITKIQAKEGASARKLAAAEALIEDFQKKLKTLKEAKQDATDKQLKRRYEAAVNLLDEALKRLPEVGVLGRRSKALESLLQASIDKFKGEKFEAKVQECLAQVPQNLHEHIKPMLEKCVTVEQVAESFKALMAVSGKKPTERTREPLPGQGSKKTVTEEKKPAGNQAPATTNYAARLGARLTKAVS